MLKIDELENIFQDFPVPALILTADKYCKILQVNDAYTDSLDLLPDDICGRPLFEVFPDQMPDDPQSPIKRTRKCILQAINENMPQTPGTIPYWLPVGVGEPKLRSWMLQYIPVVDQSGAVVYIFQLTHEVKRKNTPILPAAVAELPYESIFASAQNPFFLSDRNGKVLAVNEAACKIFGYTEEELKALGRYDVLELDDNLKHLLVLRERDGKARGEATAICKSGERFPCDYSSVNFMTRDGQVRNCTEITDIRKWKNAENKVLRSEENLRAIFDNSIEGFVLVNTTLEIITFNDKAGGIIFEHNNLKPVVEGTNLLDYLPEERREAFRQVASRALLGNVVEYERDYTFAGEDNRWFSFTINPVNKGNSVVGLCISGRDITQQKRAEQEVAKSEKRFRKMVEYNADAIAIFSDKGRVMYVSPAAEQITGYSTKEIRQMDVFTTVHPDDLEKAKTVIAKIYASPGVPIKASPIRLQHKQGGWRWIEATLTNLLDDPEVRGIIDNFKDITERVAYEHRLLEAQYKTEQSEEKYRKIFNKSPLPKWIYDLKTLCILEVNEEAVRHYGYTREEFLSMTILDIRPTEDVDSVHEVIQGLDQSFRKPLGFWRHIKKNREIIFVDITGHTLDYGGKKARMVICKDITEKIKDQVALMRSNERFRQAARASSDAIWDWDLSCDTIYLGEGFSSLFGYDYTTAIGGRNWIAGKLYSKDRLRVLSKIEAVLSGKDKEQWRDEYRFKKADNTYAIICNSVVLIRDENDQPLRMIGAMKDITNLKEEEYHLKLLESVITNTTDAVVIMSPIVEVGDSPNVIFCNPAFYNMTGYTPEEIKSTGMILLHGPKTDLEQIAKLKLAMKEKRDCLVQAIFYKKDGQPYWASLAISPVWDAQGNVKNYIAIERDITERMDYLTAIEEQNAQLREIAWFQSHIVRAPLARILGLTELLLDDNDDNTSAELLPMLKNSAEELDMVIQEILRKTNNLNLTKS